MEKLEGKGTPLQENWAVEEGARLPSDWLVSFSEILSSFVFLGVT